MKSLLFAIAGGVALGAAIYAQTTTRVDDTPAGAPSFGATGPSISADGRWVVFESLSDDLVPGDTNGWVDVFVRDTFAWTTERVSVSSSGEQGNGASLFGGQSSNGRYVVFVSWSTNLVAGDTNAIDDVFLRDRWLGTTTRVNLAWNGAQAQGDEGASSAPSVSDDGTRIAFTSLATNLVPGDLNGLADVFVRDTAAGTTIRVAETPSGAGSSASIGGVISADGSTVAFVSWASNLVAGDTNGIEDVFVRDLASGTLTRVNQSSGGAQSNGATEETPSISADGRFVAFASAATNLVAGDTNGEWDAFVHDRTDGSTARVSVGTNGVQADLGSYDPALSADGCIVVFASDATNLVPINLNGHGNVFLRNCASAATELVSLPSDAVFSSGVANGASSWPRTSSDGRRIVFTSLATNLVPLDGNGTWDVYLRDRTGCSPENYCTAKVNSAGCTPSIQFDGAPRATPGFRFLVGATQVLASKTGILIYGVNGPKAAPFQGGTMCVASPVRRTPPRTARPLGAPPCTGLYSFDFNGHIASGADPALAPGRQVWAQYWMRDDGSPSGTGLTDGLMFTICE